VSHGVGAVYVVAKAPRAGAVKTRLCPPLTADQAAELARAFLLDTLNTVARADLVPRIMCGEGAELQALQAIVGTGTHVAAQSGVGLGQALESAFHEGFADGFKAVAVLGADSPTLPATVLQEAFLAIEDREDVVVGRSDDGGYYLLAARAMYPSLFREMPWSTPAVANETLRRCRALGLRPYLLPTWYDVDDAGTLARLRGDLARLPRSVARRTRAVLRAWSTGAGAVGAPPIGASVAA
jgi:rSAM/selenodomain-associated transferase 1